MDTAYDFSYTGLDPASDSIRLLSLEGRADDVIIGNLTAFSLSENPPYIALSYTWQPQNPAQLIQLNGRNFSVGKNLHNALRSILRLVQSPVRLDAQDQHVSPNNPSKWKYFWIDAICINQRNTEERNHQVRFMKDIYANSAFVLSWLGLEEGNRLPLATYFRTCLPQQRSSLLGGTYRLPLRYVLDIDTWICQLISLKHFFRLPYWTRLWIVQEILLAPDVLFCWNDQIMKGHTLRGWLEDLKDIPNCSNERASLLYSLSKDPITKSARDLLNWRFHPAVGFPCRQYTLENLITTFSSYACLDPRDKVFGLLGLVDLLDEDWFRPSLVVDYHKTAEEIFWNVVDVIRYPCWTTPSTAALQCLRRELRVSSSRLRAALQRRSERSLPRLFWTQQGCAAYGGDSQGTPRSRADDSRHRHHHHHHHDDARNREMRKFRRSIPWQGGECRRYDRSCSWRRWTDL
jgi:hypothetical protein